MPRIETPRSLQMSPDVQTLMPMARSWRMMSMARIRPLPERMRTCFIREVASGGLYEPFMASSQISR